jgi:hypothetical protein
MGSGCGVWLLSNRAFCFSLQSGPARWGVEKEYTQRPDGASAASD